MSADLLAEFGDFSQSSGKEIVQEANTASGNANLLLDLRFPEKIEAVKAPVQSSQPRNTQNNSISPPTHAWSEPTRVEQPGSPPQRPLTQVRVTPTDAAKTSHNGQLDQALFRREDDRSNVLFDATTENPWTEDDFGEFETGDAFPEKATVVTSSGFTPSLDLGTASDTISRIEKGAYVPPKTEDFIEDLSSNAAFPKTFDDFEGPSSNASYQATRSVHELPIRKKSVQHSTTLEPVLQQASPTTHETIKTGTVGQEDDWGDFMDAPAGDFESDEISSYPPNIPTISSSPSSELDLPSEQVHPNSESMFGFVPMPGKKAGPSLANLERPTSVASPAITDDEDSPGWDWKVSAGPKSASNTDSQNAAPPSLLRPSLAKTQRPSSFSTVASSDGDRSPGWDWKASAPPDPVEHVRPFNIPPPSLLLQLIPPIFERFQERVFQETMSRSSDKLKDTSLLELGREVGAVSRVVGHVLAGRKHRWRRDTNLSQNMKIGPAQTGKGGGMKLTGVDKSESTKEEREAEDVLQTWRKYAGLFRSAISSAGGTVVELYDNMPIKTLGQSQGAFKATHACALCGLMRDERVAKVDGQEIQDSFGEWWTEHWGHLECRLFWEENQTSLSQRK